MALYLVGNTLVSARDGNHAKELTGVDNITPRRVKEDEPHGIVEAVDIPVYEEEEDEEIEITGLADRGIRRFNSKRTGVERTEPRD